MDNLYRVKPFNNEVLRVLADDGIIVVKRTWDNVNISKLEKIAEKNGFVIVKTRLLKIIAISRLMVV